MAARQVMVALDAKRIAEHGQNIYIYKQMLTNRIVYSLSRTLDNNAALKQLTFLGKKTVPPKIRKDAWSPLATVCFPTAPQGLIAYKELREFSKRHLHEWTIKDVEKARELAGLKPFKKPWENPENRSRSYKKLRRRFLAKRIGPALQDQKANSIADLAAVLHNQARAARRAALETEDEREKNSTALVRAHTRLAELLKMRKELESKTDAESLQQYRKVKLEKMRLQKAIKAPMPYAAIDGTYHIKNDLRPPAKRGFLRRLRQRDVPRPTMDGVKIEWADPTDAGYAIKWPSAVAHETMKQGEGRSRNIPTTAHIITVADEVVPETAADAPSDKPEHNQTLSLPKPEVPQTRLSKLISRLRDGSR